MYGSIAKGKVKPLYAAEGRERSDDRDEGLQSATLGKEKAADDIAWYADELKAKDGSTKAVKEEKGNVVGYVYAPKLTYEPNSNSWYSLRSLRQLLLHSDEAFKAKPMAPFTARAARFDEDDAKHLFLFLDSDGDGFITATDLLDCLMTSGIYPGEEELKTTLAALKSGNLSDFLSAMKNAAADDIPLLMERGSQNPLRGIVATMALVNRQRYMISQNSGRLPSLRQEGADAGGLMNSKRNNVKLKTEIAQRHAAEDRMIEYTFTFFCIYLFMPITYWFAEFLVGRIAGWEDSDRLRYSKSRKHHLHKLW